MAEADIHLKLDRIIATQADHSRDLTGFGESFALLDRGLGLLRSQIGTLREALDRLNDAVGGEEPGSGDLDELIRRISAQLTLQNDALHQMTAAIRALPRQIETATIDAVRLATGDGVDVPHP